jgi:uncharacterized protein YaaN involved in tellurite resistance
MPWSSTSPMWKISADDILRMLRGDATAAADLLRRRAQALLDEINKWSKDQPPSDEHRKDVIARIMTLYRETHEHVAQVRQQKP